MTAQPKTSYREADPRDVKAFARSLPEAFLRCRRLGHAWDPYTVVKVGRSFESIIQCNRCFTRRLELLTSHGAVTKVRHLYPEGYLAKDLGRIVGAGRDVLRLEMARRTLRKAS